MIIHIIAEDVSMSLDVQRGTVDGDIVILSILGEQVLAMKVSIASFLDAVEVVYRSAEVEVNRNVYAYTQLVNRENTLLVHSEEGGIKFTVKETDSSAIAAALVPFRIVGAILQSYNRRL